MVQIEDSMVKKFWNTNKDLLAPGVSKNRIIEVENELGIFFPNKYKQLISVYNGGPPIYRCFNYFDNYKKELIIGSIDMLPLIDREDNVVETLIDPPEFFPKGLVPFADDGGGDLTCFDYRNCKENPPIVFWVCGDNEGEDVHFVANTFEEFINILHESED